MIRNDHLSTFLKGKRFRVGRMNQCRGFAGQGNYSRQSTMGDAGLSSLISAHQMCNIRAKPVTSYRFAGLRHQCGFINCMKHSAPAGKETLGGDSYTKAGSTNPYTLCSIFQESKTTLKSNFLRTRFRKKKCSVVYRRKKEST